MKKKIKVNIYSKSLYFTLKNLLNLLSSKSRFLVTEILSEYFSDIFTILKKSK